MALKTLKRTKCDATLKLMLTLVKHLDENEQCSLHPVDAYCHVLEQVETVLRTYTVFQNFFESREDMHKSILEQIFNYLRSSV
jgi:hypothetical protein